MKTGLRFKVYTIAVTLCCMYAFPSIAQDKGSGTEPEQSYGYVHKEDSSNFLAEKIYLQLDNKAYTTDQTVWFKAIVTLASDHTGSMISSVLHVDLIDQNELIIEKKLIRLVNGIGDGFFQLNSNYTDGHYQVRAYTEWNRNFGPDFFFKEYIKIYSEGSAAEPNPIQNLTLTGAEGQRRIKATINPSIIDSLHSRELTLFVTADDKHDTIEISRSGRNNYQLDYAVPAGSNFITLKLNTKNNAGYSRTIAMDENFLDLQFFPESGEMVHGVQNVLGFKALDGSGKGVKVAGEILNSKDQVITTFTSNGLGMGSVFLTDVDSAERYSARLTEIKDRPHINYPLPAVVPRGNVLAVRKMKERIYLNATSNYLVNDSVIVRASCRGQAYFDFKGRLREGAWAFSLPADILPEGIISFTLMTSSRNPVAERLYFNERPENRIQLSLKTDKEIYSQRELTKLAISTTDSAGRAVVDADLSVMVLNKGDVGNFQDVRENILSYFLLSSDLRGRIEAAGSYFTDNITRYQDLDALLLTQGWRKYKYTRPPDSINFKPERNLTVSGYVGALLAQRKERAGVPLTMLVFGPMPDAQTQTTDSLGRFSFNIDGQEGNSVDVMVQSNSKSGKQKDYSIIFDTKKSPEVSFDPIFTIQKPDSIERVYIRKSLDRKKAEDAYIRSTEGIALQEVVVTETALSPQKKLVEEKYGKARTVISGDDIRKNEEKWSYGLYSILMFKFPQVQVRQTYIGLYASIPNSELTLVVVDGVPVMWEIYNQIASIPPSEVKSLELIPYAKNFRSLFCETLPPDACGMNSPTRGNVIAIYTYAGKGLFGARSPVGLSRHTLPVFAAPREFYTPKYEQLTKEDWKKPDKRTLVHWQPQVRTDSLGNASVSFYNADNTGPQSVVVEAISPDGKIGYKELKVDVHKSN